MVIEKWLTIDEHMDTFLALLTAIASIGSLVVIFQGFELAKKWKEQLVVKSSLDEYYRYRESLFNELENLKLICEKITSNDVKEAEILSPRPILEALWRQIPKGSGISFSSLEPGEMIHIFFKRLESNRVALCNSVSNIQTMLVFADIDLFSDLFEKIHADLYDLESNTGHARIGMTPFHLYEFENELLTGRRGHEYDFRMEPWELSFCLRWLQSFFGEDYKSQLVVESITMNIRVLQRAIIDYPKSRL